MTTVTKTYEINAPLILVFQALTDVDKIKIWSGADAIMEIKEEGEFSLWEGTIHGINKQINKQHIIQDWKESNWSTYSNVVFTLKEVSKDITQLSLLHENIPASSVKSIDGGWDDYYLGPLKTFVEQSFQ